MTAGAEPSERDWLEGLDEKTQVERQSETYLPMNCPSCDRRRLLAVVVVNDVGRGFVQAGTIECEKCGWKTQ